MVSGCWWSHKWSKWQETGRGNTLCRRRIAGYTVSETVDGTYIGQERYCDRCGDIQKRTLIFDLNGRKQERGLRA